MRRLLVPLLLALLLPGCEGMALHDAELKDSPEAYEAFLSEYPDSEAATRLRARIDKLRFLRAKSAKTSEGMREYISLHPEGKHIDEARKLEDELSFAEAAVLHTPEAYQAYLDSHPDGIWVEKARWSGEQLTYLPKIAIGPLQVEPINMARDPEGPLNGYGVRAELVNNGERTLRVVEMAVEYLNGRGEPVKTDRWWAVAPDLGGFPTPPEMKPPLRPGGTRTFDWSTAEKPSSWADGRFAIKVTKVEFLKKD